MTAPLSRQAATQLIVIRTALLTGILLFGGATWFTQRQGARLTLAPDKLQLLGYVFVGLVVFAVAGLAFLRSRVASMTAPAQIMATYIIGYALAEGAALFGGVVWYMGGSRNWYMAGIVLMVLSFQILPVKRPA